MARFANINSMVLHFASLIQVGESVANPTRDVVKPLTLLEAMKDHGVGPLISSMEAVFGEPGYVLIQSPIYMNAMNQSTLDPLALQAALASRPPFKIFGRYYNTPDGICIRDY